LSRPRVLALVIVTLALARPVLGHELGLVQVEGTFRKDGTYVIDILVDLEHLPPQKGERASPDEFLRLLEDSTRLTFGGTIRRPEAAEISPPHGGRSSLARLRLTGRTPPAVSTFAFANSAIPGTFVLVLGTEGHEDKATQWVEGGVSSSPFPLDRTVVPLARWEVVAMYAGLGFKHILPRGLDHVLFVLGLFLLAVELRPLLWQVSAFTLAHTITLALTVYGVVSLPSSVVEPLIALSIVYVAVENIFTARLRAWRPAVVFCFGLLHGMGFAGILTEVGLPRSEFIPALVSFNAGVECGQLAVILAAFLLFGLPFRAKPWYRRRVVVPGSLLVAAIGLYWSVQRIL
jgi:hypothetical protein